MTLSIKQILKINANNDFGYIQNNIAGNQPVENIKLAALTTEFKPYFSLYRNVDKNSLYRNTMRDLVINLLQNSEVRTPVQIQSIFEYSVKPKLDGIIESSKEHSEALREEIEGELANIA
jgi:hypothetical protein